MQIHQIQPKNKNRKAQRVGRGGKRGTYSGRGMKGQKSRAGTRFQPRVREMLKRYPKLRGYKRSAGEKPAVVSLEALENKFESGETVNPESLVKRKLLGTIGKKPLQIKILAKGEVTKPLTIEGCAISKAAQQQIEKAGGSVKIS